MKFLKIWFQSHVHCDARCPEAEQQDGANIYIQDLISVT